MYDDFDFSDVAVSKAHPIKYDTLSVTRLTLIVRVTHSFRAAPRMHCVVH